MIQQNDTIQAANTAPEQAATRPAPGKPATPWQVLKQLPATATPWQQDSAIRANFKFEEEGWLTRPNPMRTPTTKVDMRHLDVGKPLYHSQSLVQPDSVYRPECVAYRPGMAGDPVPYSLAQDSIITSLLLGCFVCGSIAIGQSGSVLWKQMKDIFHHRPTRSVMSETSGELRFQLFMVLQTCLLSALIYFFHLQNDHNEMLTVEHYKSMASFTIVFAVYIAVKALVQWCVQIVFFDKKQAEHYAQFYLFIVAMAGLALFPAALLMAYFGLAVESVVAYALCILVACKMMALYKVYGIFFKQDNAYVQVFLYFCALELMPLGALLGAITMTVNYLNTYL